MGYIIVARDENENRIASFEGPAGIFKTLQTTGYDWFGYLNAWECDGGASGTGVRKTIALKDVKTALERLVLQWEKGTMKDQLERKTRLHALSDDAFHQGINFSDLVLQKSLEGAFLSALDLVPELLGFMNGVVKWCETNSKKEVVIDFG